LGGCLAPCRELRRFSGAQQEKGPLRGFSPPQFLPSSRAEGHRLSEGGKRGGLVSVVCEEGVTAITASGCEGFGLDLVRRQGRDGDVGLGARGAAPGSHGKRRLGDGRSRDRVADFGGAFSLRLQRLHFLARVQQSALQWQPVAHHGRARPQHSGIFHKGDSQQAHTLVIRIRHSDLSRIRFQREVEGDSARASGWLLV
jgi:hypothetical protein